MAEQEKSWLSKNAGGMIGGAIGAIGGMLDIGGNRARRKQIEQQGKLNDLNAKTAKELADYDNAGKLKMWNDTNYSAQMKHAEQAGLSKVAVLGGSGGGTQGASVGSVGGGNASDEASTKNANNAQTQTIMQMMAQTALLGAQKRNVEADTDLKKADATGTGVDTGIKLETKADVLKDVAYRASEQVEKYREQFNKAQISEETQRAEIARIKAEAVGEGIKNELMKQGITLTKAQVGAIAENLKQGWAKIGIDQQNATTNKRMANVAELNQLVSETLGRQSGQQRNAELDQRQWEALQKLVTDIGGMAVGARGTTTETSQDHYRDGEHVGGSYRRERRY